MRSIVAWRALAAVLAVEVAATAVLLIGMVPTFPGSQGSDGASLVPLWASLFASVAIAWVWIGATLVGALRSRHGWVRASAVTIHILVFAAAIGVLQGILGTVPIGLAMMALGIAGFVAAVLAKPEESSVEPTGTETP